MSTRPQKRKTGRAPAVWHGTSRAAGERPVIDHGVQGNFGVSWRMFSAVMVIILVIVLAVFFVTDLFYVRSIVVVGTNYLDDAEVFRLANIANVHVFWVDPAEVRQSILAASVVADVRVVIEWPPDMVKIFVQERAPALMWIQGNVFALVDLQGRVLRNPPENEQHPELLRVIVDATIQDAPLVGEIMPVDAVNGALQLRTMLAGLQQLRYNPNYGLGFREPGGWDVWLGVGTDMPNKLIVYEAIRQDLQGRGITPVYINVANPEAAYYCGSIEVCNE